MIPVYQVDAFADHLFEGNPAAVCPLTEWLPEETMQQIASENNLAETAFFCTNENPLTIRWFTPAYEVDLCGHATLASAHVLRKHLGYEQNKVSFNSRSGVLNVHFDDDFYILDFPQDEIVPINSDHAIQNYFSIKPSEIWRGKSDYLFRYENRHELEMLSVDFAGLKNDSARGVITTAPGQVYDFISRCYFPGAGIDEDPVTGSAHTSLGVYWKLKTGKTIYHARQISKRGGNLNLELVDDRIRIKGKAITFLEGKIHL